MKPGDVATIVAMLLGPQLRQVCVCDDPVFSHHDPVFCRHRCLCGGWKDDCETTEQQPRPKGLEPHGA